MKLLVLAQTPPPTHGQSIMVQTLVDGLPAHGIPVHHVNLPLSHDAADIGRWRIGKFFTVLGACLRTIFARFARGCETLYYVPAPGKRGALYRDWTVMFFCRIFFRHTILHWHATGLSDWLKEQGNPIERFISQILLGRVSLSIALSESLQADARYFRARKIAIVANGVADPGLVARPKDSPVRLLFIGLCSEEKGFFAAMRAIIAANRTLQSPVDNPAFVLTIAGAFPDYDTERRFQSVYAEYPFAFSYAGIVSGEKKSRLFQQQHGLCLPTRYAAEGQPLVLLEAMACDLTVIATRWRGIPDALPPQAALIEPGDDEALLTALLHLRETPPTPGIFRAHYLAHFTTDKHLNTLASALNDMVL